MEKNLFNKLTEHGIIVQLTFSQDAKKEIFLNFLVVNLEWGGVSPFPIPNKSMAGATIKHTKKMRPSAPNDKKF